MELKNSIWELWASAMRPLVTENEELIVFRLNIYSLFSLYQVWSSAIVSGHMGISKFSFPLGSYVHTLLRFKPMHHISAGVKYNRKISQTNCSIN